MRREDCKGMSLLRLAGVTVAPFFIIACTEEMIEEKVVNPESVGESLYFDVNLSEPPGQSCASCHLPEAGFADPDQDMPTSEGAVAGLFGNRNTPSASYAAHIPEFQLISSNFGRDRYLGGQFWDGRASTLEEQAEGPFLNPVEMNNASKADVIAKIKASSYAEEFEDIFGAGALDDVETAYTQATEAIAAFERTVQFSPFTSKFDAEQQRLESFTQSEESGQNIFDSRCGRCHSSNRVISVEVFSDFQYRNIGVPANPNNPFLDMDSSFNPEGAAFIDLGLGAVVNDPRQNGKFRTPNLRNIENTAPYMHNGVFQTLEEVIDFYNRRDIDNIQPEVDQNVDNSFRMGEMNLSESDVQDLLAFLKTMTDR